MWHQVLLWLFVVLICIAGSFSFVISLLLICSTFRANARYSRLCNECRRNILNDPLLVKYATELNFGKWELPRTYLGASQLYHMKYWTCRKGWSSLNTKSPMKDTTKIDPETGIPLVYTKGNFVELENCSLLITKSYIL